MARGSRIPIDEKIAKAQEKADRAKKTYDKAVRDLKALQAKKASADIEDVLKAAIKSGKTPEELRALLEG